ncbi:unnamed protein product [Rhizophagus irregularis]|nr:unnamed protein product [Rhizophagus irregularis]CAB5189060.1 unnamed protein product [Rhizophagus irregularis]
MNCDPFSSNQDNACNNIPEILWRTLGQLGHNKKSSNDEKEQNDEGLRVIGEFNQTDQIHVSQYVNAIIFGILIALLMWILLRITKPTLYLPWMKDRKRKSQKRLEELSQQKNNKILEIKNNCKLPVIITNVDILCQFWDN